MTKPELIERPPYDGPHWIEDDTARNPYCVRGDVVFVKITKGRIAVLDLTDWGPLKAFRWLASIKPKAAYAVSSPRKDVRAAYMHRAVLAPARGMFVDHISGDGLDNRRLNLRACTNQENLWNARLPSDNTSGFKGVRWHKQCRKWCARGPNVPGARQHLGVFVCKEEAARAYDRAAIQHYGEFARLNFPRSEYEKQEQQPDLTFHQPAPPLPSPASSPETVAVPR